MMTFNPERMKEYVEKCMHEQQAIDIATRLCNRLQHGEDDFRFRLERVSDEESTLYKKVTDTRGLCEHKQFLAQQAKECAEEYKLVAAILAVLDGPDPEVE